jgi:hypothetical protein
LESGFDGLGMCVREVDDFNIRGLKIGLYGLIIASVL